MGKPTRHMFVCVNERPVGGKPSCAGRGSAALVTALQTAIARRPELWGRAAVTGCGCLGPCFDGPNAVVYPEGVWYAGVGLEDVDELVEVHLAGGQPVERLRYDFGDDD